MKSMLPKNRMILLMVALTVLASVHVGAMDIVEKASDDAMDDKTDDKIAQLEKKFLEPGLARSQSQSGSTLRRYYKVEDGGSRVKPVSVPSKSPNDVIREKAHPLTYSITMLGGALASEANDDRREKLKTEQIPALIKLIEDNTDLINEPNTARETPAQLAAHYGLQEVLKKLIEENADLEGAYELADFNCQKLIRTEVEKRTKKVRRQNIIKKLYCCCVAQSKNKAGSNESPAILLE